MRECKRTCTSASRHTSYAHAHTGARTNASARARVHTDSAFLLANRRRAQRFHRSALTPPDDRMAAVCPSYSLAIRTPRRASSAYRYPRLHYTRVGSQQRKLRQCRSEAVPVVSSRSISAAIAAPSNRQTGAPTLWPMNAMAADERRPRTEGRVGRWLRRLKEHSRGNRGTQEWSTRGHGLSATYRPWSATAAAGCPRVQTPWP